MRRGVFEAFVVVFGGCIGFAFASNGLIPIPSGHFFVSLAQIGATLLVADAVQIGWFLQNSRKRGADSENWAGVMAGLSSCALIGITISLLLAEHQGRYTWIDRMGFGWVVMSLFLLGVLIALQPLTTYEWTHSLHTEYPDE